MKLFKIKKDKEDKNKVIEPFLEESSVLVKILIVCGILLLIFFIWYIFLRKKKINVKKRIPKNIIPVAPKEAPKKSSYNEVVEKYPTERSNSIFKNSVFVNPMNPF